MSLFGAQVDLDGLAGRQVLDEQVDHGVGAAGPRVALLDHRGAAGADVGARDHVDAALVDAGVGDAGLAGVPPIAGEAVHLLLGHELGRAERQGVLALGGQGLLGPAGRPPIQGLDVEVLVADIGDVGALGRDLGVDLVAGSLGQARDLAVGDAVQIEVAVQRHQDEAAFLVPAVFDDAAGRDAGPFAAGLLGFRQLLAARRQGRRVDQAVGLAALDVGRPQVLDVGRLGLALQVGDALAVRRQGHALGRGAAQGRVGEDPFGGEFFRQDRRRQGEAGRDGQERGSDHGAGR
jgi:hypothetical protein